MSELLNEAAHPRTDRPGSTAPGWSRMQVPAGKLSPPPLGFGPLLRPRLLEALSRGVAETPVTLLSGPAGSGKTLLASSWALEQHDHPPVAWLSLDAADDDPSMFWPYLLAALDRAGIELAVPPSEPGPAGSTPMGWPVSPAAALSGLQQRVVLIIDGADNLITPALTQALDLLVRHAGGRLRLVLCARADPLLPLHRYRLAERLTEIRTDQLAFTSRRPASCSPPWARPCPADVAALLRGRPRDGRSRCGWPRPRSTRGVRSRALVTALAADDGSVAQYLFAEVLEQPAAPGPPLPAADQRRPPSCGPTWSTPLAGRPGPAAASSPRWPRRTPSSSAPRARPAASASTPCSGRCCRLSWPTSTPARFAACTATCAGWYAAAGRPAGARSTTPRASGDQQLGRPPAHRRPRRRPHPRGRSSLRTAAGGRRHAGRGSAAVSGCAGRDAPGRAAGPQRRRGRRR